MSRSRCEICDRSDCDLHVCGRCGDACEPCLCGCCEWCCAYVVAYCPTHVSVGPPPSREENGRTMNP